MPKRRFQTQQLINWGVHDEENEIVVHDEILGMDKFECECERVFRAPDDGKLWRFTYERNDGAGYDDIVGTSYGSTARPELPYFDAVEVEAVEVITTKYRPVED